MAGNLVIDSINGVNIAVSPPATQAYANSYDLGVNQTWQDVTASRVSGTTYTNSTGKPICISISGTRNSSATPGSFQLTINDVIVGYAATAEAQSTWNALRETIFGVIPPGGTYYITSTNNIINTWSELR